MSYVRFAWGPNNEFPGTPEAKAAGPSDLYLIGTTRHDDEDAEIHGIECCGCILPGDDFPFFAELDGMLGHLDEHRKAGHTVHAYVQPAVEEDFTDGKYVASWVTR